MKYNLIIFRKGVRVVLKGLIKILLAKKTIVITMIVIFIIIGIVVLQSKVGFSSSPGATVESFYSALNKGDVSKDESYLAPGKEIGNISPFRSGFIVGDRKWEEAMMDRIEFLTGKIKEVEIEGERVESAFGSKEAAVVYKIVIRPDAIAEAEEIIKIEKDDHSGLLRHFSEKVYFDNCWLVDLDGKEGTYYLQKRDEKWKIFSY